MSVAYAQQIRDDAISSCDDTSAELIQNLHFSLKK